MRMTSKGQVTIPIEIREKLGLQPNSEVEFEVDGNAVRMTKSAVKVSVAGRALVERLSSAKGVLRLTTDEIMAMTRGGGGRRRGRHARR